MAMNEDLSPGKRIAEAVTAWRGVEQAPHRFGGTEFRLGKRGLVHLHGDALVDLPFPRKVRDELVAAGRARSHHVLPSAWCAAGGAGRGTGSRVTKHRGKFRARRLR